MASLNDSNMNLQSEQDQNMRYQGISRIDKENQSIDFYDDKILVRGGAEGIEYI